MNSVASMNKKRKVDEMESDEQNEMRLAKIQKTELEQRKCDSDGLNGSEWIRLGMSVMIKFNTFSPFGTQTANLWWGSVKFQS